MYAKNVPTFVTEPIARKGENIPLFGAIRMVRFSTCGVDGFTSVAVLHRQCIIFNRGRTLNTIFFRFKNQSDTSYYFEIGFFNEGLKLPSFGSNPLQQMFALSDILEALPKRLYEGALVGGYEIPTNLLLRGCKARPWIPEDLLDDILVAWEPLVGFIAPQVYECLYTPVIYDLPEDYSDALDAAVAEGDSKYYIPNDEDSWPEQYETGEYQVESIAGSVRNEGAFLQSGFEWLYAGEGEDEDTDLINRLWGSPEYYPKFTGHWVESVSSFENLWGVYDSEQPEVLFLGLITPKRKVDIFTGLNATFPFPVSEDTEVIWPFLFPIYSGDAVRVSLPESLVDDFVFPLTEIQPLATPPQLGPVPHSFLLPLMGLLFPQTLQSLFPIAKFTSSPFNLSASRDYVVVVNSDDPMTINADDHVQVGF